MSLYKIVATTDPERLQAKIMGLLYKYRTGKNINAGDNVAEQFRYKNNVRLAKDGLRNDRDRVEFEASEEELALIQYCGYHVYKYVHSKDQSGWVPIDNVISQLNNLPEGGLTLAEYLQLQEADEKTKQYFRSSLTKEEQSKQFSKTEDLDEMMVRVHERNTAVD